MQAIFCYIDDQKRYHRLFFDHSWLHGLDGTECGKSTAYGALRKRFLKAAEEIDFFAEKSEIYHFSIIRHPIGRFISAFIDICINRARRPRMSKLLCFACRGNLECFVPKLHDFLYKQSVHRPVNKWPLDWHFLPQSWYCDYDRYLNKYDQLLRYGRNDQFRTEVVDMLGKRGVPPDLLSDIEKQLKTKKNLHATFDRSSEYEKKLMNNPLLLEYVYKIYHLDFVWFGYRLNTTNTGE
uniref:Sulfotransferase family protein n=1 Tax=Plectus sambesii TaxID=2011161 RepID=A0A914WK96_9BILA